MYSLLRSIIPVGILAAVALVPTYGATINFGVDFEASDTYNGNSIVAGNVGNTEASIASLINQFAGTSFTEGDILKTNKEDITALGSGTNDQFAVGAGFNWLLVKYDGPNGGIGVFQLNGNDALVPFDSAPTWGSLDQYGVSHYAVAGRASVPDAGATAAMLGLALAGLVALRRKLS